MTERTAANPKALIEHVAKALVSAPDQVRVEEVPEDAEIVIELEVAEDDMGRVIGKSGKVARAMRNLLHAAGDQARSALRVGDSGIGLLHPDNEFITLARVAKTQGRRGEVAVEVHSDVPGRLQAGMRVFALAKDRLGAS